MDSLPVGQISITQAGQDGGVHRHLSGSMVDGKAGEKPELSNEVTTPAVSEIVEAGARKTNQDSPKLAVTVGYDC